MSEAIAPASLRTYQPSEATLEAFLFETRGDEYVQV